MLPAIIGKKYIFPMIPQTRAVRQEMLKLQSMVMRKTEKTTLCDEEMTHTTLSRQLKALEREGLIVRKEYSQVPPRVEYCLSEIGSKFSAVLAELEIWGNEYIDYMNKKAQSEADL